MIAATRRTALSVAAGLIAGGVIAHGHADRDDLLQRLGAYVDAWERELGLAGEP